MLASLKNCLSKIHATERKVSICLNKFKPFRAFLSNRRAISAVISNMILIAAVIILGFVALFYAQSNATSYQTQYQQTVNSDISKLKEVVSFEYANYNAVAKTVTVYFINSGQIPVTVNQVFLNSSAQSMSFSMFYKNGQPSSSRTLSNGQEGYVVLSTNLASGLYGFKITTGRQSSFEYNFAV